MAHKEKPEAIRTFSTGATRNTDRHKKDYEGFFSPLVMECYARYMHSHRRQKDGSLRDSDNWQKGIPREAYMKSAWRHFMAWWTAHRGWKPTTAKQLEEAICGVIFNASGYLHEHLAIKLNSQPRKGPPLHGTDLKKATAYSWNVEKRKR
jgi:hypothetical protein